MPATHEISATLIRDNITRAINDVFKTMLSRTVQLIETPAEPGKAWPPVPEVAAEVRPQVVGTVGFIGDANGLIYFYLDLAFARLVTSRQRRHRRTHQHDRGQLQERPLRRRFPLHADHPLHPPRQ
jgi:hypothetical protein